MPVSAFWSHTLYETETRSMIQNPRNDSALSSYDTLEHGETARITAFPVLEMGWIGFISQRGQSVEDSALSEALAKK